MYTGSGFLAGPPDGSRYTAFISPLGTKFRPVMFKLEKRSVLFFWIAMDRVLRGLSQRASSSNATRVAWEQRQEKEVQEAELWAGAKRWERRRRAGG